jgi:poly(3-hydroxybutyrate) depolymerase
MKLYVFQNISFFLKDKPMDKPLSTTDVPSQFLKAAFLVGHVPLKALNSDPRVSYALYIPPAKYSATIKLPLLVWIHGTLRKWTALFEEEMTSFAATMPCAVLAPLFPAGLDGPNDLDYYKTLYSASLRSDLALLSILEEVSQRWPNIDTDKIFLAGFSGGGQFVHRFLYLYPERLVAASIGAPGRVTMLDKERKWPDGVADVQKLFGRSISKQQIRQVAIQLVVGSADDKVHGDKAFWEWLQHVKGRREEQSHGTLSTMSQGRVQTLQDLQTAWEKHGIDSQLTIVEGISHEVGRARKKMLEFLQPFVHAVVHRGLEDVNRASEQ